MTVGTWLQAGGALLELAGLAVVMLGISETRRAFTNRPSLLRRLSTPFRWLVGQFRKPSVSVGASPASIGASASIGAAGVGHVGWEGLSPEEVLTRIQSELALHHQELYRVSKEIDEERKAREKLAHREEAARESLREHLEARVAKVAARGLTLETWGASLLALGLSLTFAGILVG